MSTLSTPFATVATSGKQYRVKSGDILTVDRLTADVGTQITLNQVVLVEKPDGSIQIGKDLSGVSVTATVDQHVRGQKLRVFKMRRRKSSRTMNGHRQDLTLLLIGDIQGITT